MTRLTARMTLLACHRAARPGPAGRDVLADRDPGGHDQHRRDPRQDDRRAAAVPALALTGICLWLRCGFRGCRIRVSPRVFNYAPDAVVTTHNAAAQHPWVELRPALAAANAGLAGLVGGLADASGSVEGRREQGNPVRARDHQTFREADLVGHPFSASGAVLGTAGLVCPPRTVPLMPYFVSSLDALAWREIVPIESLYPASLIPGLKEIGSWPVNTWGNVYPRTGIALQQEEPKAAAILAQRVGDITTRSAQPHVYVPLSQAQLSWGMKYWNPPALEPNDEDTGSWQMLAPLRGHELLRLRRERHARPVELVGRAQGPRGRLPVQPVAALHLLPTARHASSAPSPDRKTPDATSIPATASDTDSPVGPPPGPARSRSPPGSRPGTTRSAGPNRYPSP
jgi:integrating conjugative element protein (TIGR03756 family)